MTEDLTKLNRKIARLESKIELLRAECELYEMMAHDLASEPLIATIENRYPEIAAKWRAYTP